MAFWLITGFLYLSFGAAKITLFPPTYLFLEELWKYIAILTVPMIIVISVALAKFVNGGGAKQKRIRIYAAAIIILFLLITSLYADLFGFILD
jgi:hypothetical protein